MNFLLKETSQDFMLVQYLFLALNSQYIAVKLFDLFDGSLVHHVISLDILSRYVVVQRALASYHLMTDIKEGGETALLSGLCCPCCGQGD